jgi:Domain of unknown function (DUF4276)
MVKEIRIYIEGGGDGKNSKALLRQGFSKFLKELNQLARSKRIKWEIVICGSRNNAFRDFKNAVIKEHIDAFNVLLVDAEAPVNKTPWQHLEDRDNWDKPDVDDTQCHLMVQMMEAWFIADIDALNRFYGQGFKENAIPKNPNVEKINKTEIESALKKATKETSKGEYGKIQHGAKLLEQVSVAKVRAASSYCDRLFTSLTVTIDESTDRPE